MKNLTVIKHFLYGVFILLITINTSIGQSQSQYEWLTAEDGLSSNDITFLFQDSYGFIWIGTSNGLNKYDGYEIESFLSNPFDSTSLSNNYVTAIYEDKSGSIWVATFNGLNLLNLSTKKFKRYRHNPKDSTSISSNFMAGCDFILEDSRGTFWIGTDDGLNIFDKTTNKFRRVNMGVSNRSAQRIRGLYEDKTGDIWIGTDWGGLHRYSYKKNKFDSFYPNKEDKESIGHITPYNFIEDDANNLWILQYWNGINKMDLSTNCFESYVFDKNNPDVFANNLPITDFILDEAGVFWMSTSTGICSFNPKNQKIAFLERNNEDFNIPFGGILKDFQGNIWGGSFGKGVIKIITKPNGIEHYFHKPEDPNTISGNAIRLIASDSKGNVYVSTGKGIDLLDAQKKRTKTFNVPIDKNVSIPNSEITLFVEDHKGTLLFGRLNLMELDSASITLKVHHSTAGSNNGTTIMEEADKGLWIGGNGLSFYDYSTRKKEYFYPNGEGNFLMNMSTLFIDIDGSHFLLAGQWNDLVVFNKNTKKFIERIPITSTDNLTELDISVNKLFRDSNGKIWLGTKSGLSSFDYKQKSFKHYNQSNGLASNIVRTIVEDDDQNLWLGTSKGISKFNPLTENFKNYDFRDGLQGNEFNPFYATMKHPITGELWFGGNNGFNVFHPDSLKENTYVPPVIITKLKYYSKDSINEQRVKYLEDSVEKIDLSYQQNIFELGFAGLNYNNPEKNEYAYRLIGFQNDWLPIGNKTFVSFTNLNPGTYQFQVKGSNNEGIWNEKGDSIQITIHPPWWKTWWAYTLYALSFIGLLAYWYRSLQNKLKKEQVHNQELQTLNLELKDINIANQRFVPNDFLQILGKKSIKDLQLGDQVATKMTVLFSDIRDYTPLSESMTPEQNFKFINAYLGRIGPIIKAHGGFISSYLGDGLMALFVNEPQKAIQATIAMQKELEIYNQERRAAGKSSLRTGMGLNTGDLMLGVIGDEHRYESTVISDAVNTASRMEGLTKMFGAAIILSEKTLDGLLDDFPSSSKLETAEKLLDNRKLSSNSFAYRYLGKVKVKGKDKALKIYDLYEGETVAIRQLKAQTHLQFEQGITHYYQKEFGKAAECFKQVLAVNESDKAATYYLDKSVEYIVNGVAEDWSGVEEMVMK